MRQLLSAGAALALVAAGPASAQVAITFGGSAQNCYEAAKAAKKDEGSERFCTLAIDHQPMNQHDLAGAYANRGAIKFNRGDFNGAQLDFEQAILIAPKIGESYISRGAALQRMGLYSEAVEEIGHGIALNPGDPAQGYLNRGVAKFKLNDLAGAYADFKKAAELAPQWDEPKLQLEQFVVEPKP